MEEEEKIAALSASLVMLGERAIEDFKRVNLRRYSQEVKRVIYLSIISLKILLY